MMAELVKRLPVSCLHEAVCDPEAQVSVAGDRVSGMRMAISISSYILSSLDKRVASVFLPARIDVSA